jgi:hypothetical protein
MRPHFGGLTAMPTGAHKLMAGAAMRKLYIGVFVDLLSFGQMGRRRISLTNEQPMIAIAS